MAAIAFDPLEYTHQLEATGVPREQAEAHAKAMTTLFLHNLDALVTRDYLDSRFNEFEARVEVRFERVDGKFRLVFWMQALTIACVVVPMIRDLLG